MTDQDVLIDVRNVGKKFCRDLKRSLWYGVKDLSAEVTGRDGVRDRLRPKEFWAVDDVSFQVRRGECLGLIGHNGAGKSTLLKMLNGLIKPDRGSITMRGRVGALIELGAGFNSILTGRENIYVNGSVLGMTKKEIDAKFDTIVDFAEIGQFIDSPVQSYSSGMKVRLGFAIAAQLEPDILLIDEVLAVGDAGFRRRCYEAISKLRRRCAVIFVSHQMAHVSRLSAQTLLLWRGKSLSLGPTHVSIEKYYRTVGSVISPYRESNGVTVDEVCFSSKSGESIQFGQSWSISVKGLAERPVGSVVIDVVLRTAGDEPAAEISNFFDQGGLSIDRSGRFEFVANIDQCHINPAIYEASVFITSIDMLEHFAWCERVGKLVVAGNRTATAPMQVQVNWNSVSVFHEFNQIVPQPQIYS